MRQIAGFCLLFFLATTAAARPVSGQVVEIVDYQSIKILDSGGTRMTVRLAGLAELPPGHMLQQQARKRLISLVAGKYVNLDVLDAAQQPSAAVRFGGLDVSARLLQEGLAITTDDSLTGLPKNLQQRYLLAEDQARQDGRGIWFSNRSKQSKNLFRPLRMPPTEPSPSVRTPPVKR
ncbi:MAG: thermonuclease family protein [Chromatiales bacterium]|jgi:endonuclease YncB( thermonuclease family)